MEFKSFSATVEEKDGGAVRAYASTFDRVPDSVGDVVAPGAFDKTISNWKASGKPIPLLWGHDTDDPFSNIGAAIDYGTDERGLWFDAEFDADNEKAQYVRKLVKEGRVFQCSFAYAVKDAAPIELESGAKANELRELDLFEISIVQIPANQNATVEEVKSDGVIELKPRIEGLTDEQREEFTKAVAEAAHNGLEIGLKAGRRNSAKDADELRNIANAANQILEVVNGLLADDEAPTTDGDDEGEAEKSAEGQTSQAEFVDAYRQAIKEMIGD